MPETGRWVMPYKRILCATDNSATLTKAEEKAARLCMAFDAELVLLYVMDKRHKMLPVMTDSPEWADIYRGWMDEGAKALKRKGDMLKAMGVNKVSTEVRDGHPHSETMYAAAHLNADLVVMGPGTELNVRRFLSHGTDLLATADNRCNVLVVGE
jgi:nucleotide-binding universal stress UspA family protein